MFIVKAVRILYINFEIVITKSANREPNGRTIINLM